jgi:hypothetical protein
MIKSKKEARRIAEDFLKSSFPAWVSEISDVYRVGDIWVTDVRSRMTGTRGLSVKIDGNSGMIIGVEIPKKLNESEWIRKKIKLCDRCNRKYSIRELRITRTYFEGGHGHVLVLNVSCKKCKKPLSPIRLNRREQKKAFLEYLEIMHMEPEHYEGLVT